MRLNLHLASADSGLRVQDAKFKALSYRHCLIWWDDWIFLKGEAALSRIPNRGLGPRIRAVGTRYVADSAARQEGLWSRAHPEAKATSKSSATKLLSQHQEQFGL